MSRNHSFDPVLKLQSKIVELVLFPLDSIPVSKVEGEFWGSVGDVLTI